MLETDDEMLKVHRDEIDRIDYQIHSLLNERAEHVIDIGKLKVEGGASHVDDFYRPEREEEILEKITEYNQGPLSDHAIMHIFRTVMAECLSIQMQDSYDSEEEHKYDQADDDEYSEEEYYE